MGIKGIDADQPAALFAFLLLNKADRFIGAPCRLMQFSADAAAQTACADFVDERGAGVAVEFGLKLVEALSGKPASDKIRESMRCV